MAWGVAGMVSATVNSCAIGWPPHAAKASGPVSFIISPFDERLQPGERGAPPAPKGRTRPRTHLEAPSPSPSAWTPRPRGRSVFRLWNGLLDSLNTRQDTCFGREQQPTHITQGEMEPYGYS